MQLSSILEFIPSALGLFVAAVLTAFLLLLLTMRLRRVIFGGRAEQGRVEGTGSFLSNFD